MDAAVDLRRAPIHARRLGEGFPRLAMASRDDLARLDAAGPTAWPVLWARCWVRVRSWRVPPRWSVGDWWDEARATGTLAYVQARRDFDPRRGVPLDAFLYRRVVDAVWTRLPPGMFLRPPRPSGGAIADHPARHAPGPIRTRSQASCPPSTAWPSSTVA